MNIAFYDDGYNRFDTNILSDNNIIVYDTVISREKFENSLRNFTPQGFIKCKYRVNDQRISFTGCINYAIKNYLLEMNRLKVDVINKLNCMSTNQEKNIVNLTFHQIVFFSRSIKDTSIHKLLLSDIEGRRHRRYIQFYALYDGVEYVRTSSCIIKMKRILEACHGGGGINNIFDGNIHKLDNKMGMNYLQPYILNVNGALSAISGEPLLELNNYLTMLKYRKK